MVVTYQLRRPRPRRRQHRPWHRPQYQPRHQCCRLRPRRPWHRPGYQPRHQCQRPRLRRRQHRPGHRPQHQHWRSSRSLPRRPGQQPIPGSRTTAAAPPRSRSQRGPLVPRPASSWPSASPRSPDICCAALAAPRQAQRRMPTSRLAEWSLGVPKPPGAPPLPPGSQSRLCLCTRALQTLVVPHALARIFWHVKSFDVVPLSAPAAATYSLCASPTERRRRAAMVR
jgi:hypothetical protein